MAHPPSNILSLGSHQEEVAACRRGAAHLWRRCIATVVVNDGLGGSCTSREASGAHCYIRFRKSSLGATAHQTGAGSCRRSNGTTALQHWGGAFGGSDSSSKVRQHSMTCARGRRGSEEGGPRGAAAARIEELLDVLTGANRMAMAGRTRCKVGALL
jgi:hypothetical protein